MACKYIVAVAVVVSLAAAGAHGDGTAALVPGAQTSAAIMASSADGLSRYLAPDGPIQPAITAIMGVPMRAGEATNRGISRVSFDLNNGAQFMSRAAGQNGNFRMPGMQTLETVMPASVASLGQTMQGAIRSKNNFIRGQADAGIRASNRLGDMMRSGQQSMSVRAPGPMGDMMPASSMLSSTQEFMSKSSAEMQSQLQQHLNGAKNRMSGIQGMGDNVRNQAQGISRSLSNGAQGVMSQLQQTGQEVMSQLQQGHAQNTQAMSGVLGSLQGSMGTMGSNMQRNLQGVMRHAQSTAQQLSSSLSQAAQTPLQMLSSLGNGLGGMMKGGQSAGGRY